MSTGAPSCKTQCLVFCQMYTRITALNSMSTLCLAQRPRLTSIALIVDTQTTERYYSWRSFLHSLDALTPGSPNPQIPAFSCPSFSGCAIYFMCSIFSAPRRTVHTFHTALSTALRNTFSHAVHLLYISPVHSAGFFLSCITLWHDPPVVSWLYLPTYSFAFHFVLPYFIQ